MLKFIPISVIFFMLISLEAMSVEIEQPLLPACPDKPNCVLSISMDTAVHTDSSSSSSSSSDSDSASDAYIEPFHYSGELELAKKLLIKSINELPRAEIIKQQGNYLHATFTSMVFRFVDDTEFLFVDSEKLIHVRSASRTGYSDFGVNRQRVEALRKSFDAKWGKNSK